MERKERDKQPKMKMRMKSLLSSNNSSNQNKECSMFIILCDSINILVHTRTYNQVSASEGSIYDDAVSSSSESGSSLKICFDIPA